MNYLPMDPDEAVGTPEYEELRTARQMRYEQMLELMQEEHDAELLQYPQRFSH
jgi:hypothetical protein